MATELTYPMEVLVPPDGMCGLVRLETAIHAACIDAGGPFFGVKFEEDELQDYFDTHPHSYFEVIPRGGISIAFKKLKKAVGTSLKTGSLKLAVKKVDLEEKVCLLNSWVSSSEFEAWCESRSIELGESWFEIWKEEQTVAIKATDAGENYRRMLEGQSSSYDGMYDSSRENELEQKTMDDLYMQIVELRAKLATPQVIGDSLKTIERNTLLTIIAVLCKEAKLDYTKHAKSAGLIMNMAATLDISIGETTIEGYLKKIPNALATRMK